MVRAIDQGHRHPVATPRFAAVGITAEELVGGDVVVAVDRSLHFGVGAGAGPGRAARLQPDLGKAGAAGGGLGEEGGALTRGLDQAARGVDGERAAVAEVGQGEAAALLAQRPVGSRAGLGEGDDEAEVRQARDDRVNRRPGGEVAVAAEQQVGAEARGLHVEGLAGAAADGVAESGAGDRAATAPQGLALVGERVFRRRVGGRRGGEAEDRHHRGQTRYPIPQSPPHSGVVPKIDESQTFSSPCR